MKQNQEKILLRSLIDQIPSRKYGIECSGLSGSEKAYLVSEVYKKCKMPICVIAASPKIGERFIEDIHFFSKKAGAATLYFSPYNILPFKFLSYHNETAANRIRTLYKLITNGYPPILVTTVDALLQKLIPKEEICNYAELVMEDEELDRDVLIEKLVSGGYDRTSIVEEPGDFCIRGGILDVFSPLYNEPLRIEMFGDRVESLRFFSSASQRSTQRLGEAVLLPAKEAILRKDRLPQIVSRIREQASALKIPVPKIRNLIHRVKNEGEFSGIESLIPLIYPEPGTVFDYFPENALFVLDEPRELDKAAAESERQAEENYLAAHKEARLCLEPEQLYMKWSAARKILGQKKPISTVMLPLSKHNSESRQSQINFNFPVRSNSNLSLELKRHHGKEDLLSPLAQQIDEYRQSGFDTLIVCKGGAQVDRLVSMLEPYGIWIERVKGCFDMRRGYGTVYICHGQVSSGFAWPDESLVIITEDEIFGKKHHKKRSYKQKIPARALPFEELKQGDFVVHSEHGIGKYDGLVKFELNGTINDFILVLYKDNDKLYLPVDRLSMVQKYMGVEGVEPVLDKMGGTSWQRIKERVKKSVEKIAGDLLKLYAERKVHKGYAFSGTDNYFSDFEAGFPFEETADQRKAIEDVLTDMRKPVSMDRLVCGDVGYGKTEVALRASFVTVNDAKQVAVLVPTTVLAEQHYTTFSNRFQDYPVNIACLSRFRSQREQRAIINDLKTGKIDIVIGTHRLLQKDIIIKDLGLIVLDEEQRFGVKHKEKLKSLRRTVDVLALTATPIPRTLHLSLMGIRDISIISTPPEHRHPIITYITEFDDAIIIEAIRKELRRKGQLFFVHNNIHTIQSVASHLKRIVPEVRLDVAHGRLDKNVLEKVMLRFVKKEIDLLVCTTIIESGIDIPSANTMLVNRADKFGLGQMYQLRGRVGRAEEQAYAYLFIPKESALGKDAQKRLKVLMEHSDLGSGFQIAMNDLKIRGGGTILGSSQSGHIAAVGYDMFLKLMENTISEMKGESTIENLEPEINVGLSAHIPETLIPDIDQRLSAYRRLARMTSVEEITDFKSEMVDRYGPLPVSTTNLVLKIMLKVLCIQAGIKKLDLAGQTLLLYFSEGHQKDPLGIVDMIVSKPERFRFDQNHVLKVILSNKSLKGNIAESKNILKEITQHVNG